MNRVELVQAVAEATNLTQKNVSAVLEELIDTIESTVASGDKVQLIGFGTFEAKKRAARTCRNPKTGETIQVAEKQYPAFSAGKKFKEIVNK